MSLRGLLRLFLSARVTVALLCVLGLLLLLNVAVPQATLVGEEAFAEMVGASPWNAFVLERLGFGRLPTSPVFLAVLALFFVNLGSVLASRVGPTLRRVSLRPRSEEGLRAWARMEQKHSHPLPREWSVDRVVRTLQGFGYQVKKAGDRTFWGVKHRTAPLGFLLFHLSFFLLCAGGVLLYYTRFAGTVQLAEGQEFSGGYKEILRQPLVGGPPQLTFGLGEVEARLEQGRPVHLAAVLRLRAAGSASERRSEVNRPARWGATTILVQRAGLAPVLWLQDGEGFTVDRVVPLLPAEGRGVTPVPLAAEDLTALIRPRPIAEPFPSRTELAATSLHLQLVRGQELVWDGALEPGEAGTVGDLRIVLEEIHYWAGLLVVSERGGGLLVVGFVLGVVGLVWRLLWYRREIVVSWDDRLYRVVGRSEYFSGRFEEELGAVDSMLRGEGASPSSGSAASGP